MHLISILLLPLDPVNYAVSLNATRYVAEITVDTPLGTPVIFLGVSINLSNTPLVYLALLNDMNDLFKFSNGMNDEEHFPGSTNTDTIAIESQIVYNGTLPPDTYELTIHVVVTSPVIEVRGRAFVTVNLPTSE